MNILAATASESAKNQVYNVAVGDRTTLIDLYSYIKCSLQASNIEIVTNPLYRDFRKGDVRHSQADITKAKNILGYDPAFNISEGIDDAMPWYISRHKKVNI